VFALVKSRCWGCHGARGIAGHDFVDIAALRGAPVDDMVRSCQMPPDRGLLSDADRGMLLDWASCNKP
jgi:hypothetical protein